VDTAAEIRRRRVDLMWSQADLGNRAGYSEETIRKIEAGIHVRPKTLQGVLGALDAGEAGVVPGGQSGRPALNIPEAALEGLSAEQLAELEARLTAEAWRARREFLGG
jgi:transcriptional regulator with XRE-family HTH domain